MSSYRRAREADLEGLTALMHTTFGVAEEASRRWIEASGLEHWRVLEQASGVQAAAVFIPMGQWFGGRPVSMTGLAGVAVSPVGRGRGTGQHLMGSILGELHREGVALSALYGSTTSFYRRCGYGRAGARYLAEVDVRGLRHRGGPLEVRELDEVEPARALQATVREHAALRRGPYMWYRIRFPRGQTARGFGFFGPDGLEGYAYVVYAGSGVEGRSLEVSDLLLTTPDAVQAFLGFVAGHRALIETARWPSPACSPLLLALEERWSYRLFLDEHWLLRVVSLPQALEQRGYPAALVEELHLEISDELLPDNAGRWILRVAEGEGRVERGGQGDLRLGIAGFASLYTGFATARQLWLAGEAEGDQDLLTRAEEVFQGEPLMTDFF